MKITAKELTETINAFLVGLVSGETRVKIELYFENYTNDPGHSWAYCIKIGSLLIAGLDGRERNKLQATLGERLEPYLAGEERLARNVGLAKEGILLAMDNGPGRFGEILLEGAKARVAQASAQLDQKGIGTAKLEISSPGF